MINQRLFDWYGIDTNKNLKIKAVCPKPFDTALIDRNGSCFVCECTAWLPQSVGNLHSNTLQEIFNSEIAGQLRQSVSDGSYRYCNANQCQWIQKNIVEDRKDKTPSIATLRLAIDDSCNLSCPSCRTSKIFLRKGKMLSLRLSLADKIIDFLRDKENILIHIGSDGDPFASLVYRYFIRNVPDTKSFRFNFQTNGLLIKKMFKRLGNIVDRINEINISIDGASEQTYESLRRGGKFASILDNLEFLKEYSDRFKINIHMVVQHSNWHEMSKMLELAEKFNVNKVWFNKIQDWNTTKNFSNMLPPEEDSEFLKQYHLIKKHKKAIIWELK